MRTICSPLITLNKNVSCCYLAHLCFSCTDAKDRLDRASKTLVNVKAGIEHLADKLQHLKAVRTSTLWSSIIRNKDGNSHAVNPLL